MRFRPFLLAVAAAAGLAVPAAASAGGPPESFEYTYTSPVGTITNYSCIGEAVDFQGDYRITIRTLVVGDLVFYRSQIVTAGAATGTGQVSGATYRLVTVGGTESRYVDSGPYQAGDLAVPPGGNPTVTTYPLTVQIIGPGVAYTSKQMGHFTFFPETGKVTAEFTRYDESCRRTP